MAKRTSVYLSDDLEAAVNASGMPLAKLLALGVETFNERQPPPVTLGGIPIKITADERMPPGVAAIVAPDRDGKPQVQAFRGRRC